MRPLRSLPRVFIEGASSDAPIDLPKAEIEKLRKVLRLESGDEIAVLPNDGSLIRCELKGHSAMPKSVEWPDVEPKRHVTIAQALPKGERLETVLRMGTELGVSRFVVFPAIRSVARWEASRIHEKFRRLRAILTEAAEQSYRARIPEIEWLSSFQDVLKLFPKAVVLSEMESERRSFVERVKGNEVCLVVGPEGGWDPKEVALIVDRGVTLGPLVLRTDTAGVAAACLSLLGPVRE